MALFGKKKAAEAADKSEQQNTNVVSVKEKVVAPKIVKGRNLASVIVRPRITEKAALAIDADVYTFEISRNATKYDVRDAIKALYDVTPVKVHVVNKKPRHYMSRARGRDLTEKGFKKAYVYLKKGDRINLA